MEQVTLNERYYEVIAEDRLTIVKFITTWCPDCKRLNTFIDDIIARFPSIQWFEINSEMLADIAEENEVMGVPSLLTYRGGQKIGHLHSKYAKTFEQVLAYVEEMSKL